jgi:hypothetical protein
VFGRDASSAVVSVKQPSQSENSFKLRAIGRALKFLILTLIPQSKSSVDSARILPTMPGLSGACAASSVSRPNGLRMSMCSPLACSRHLTTSRFSDGSCVCVARFSRKPEASKQLHTFRKALENRFSSTAEAKWPTRAGFLLRWLDHLSSPPAQSPDPKPEGR